MSDHAFGSERRKQLVDGSAKVEAVNDFAIGEQHWRRAEQISEALVGEEGVFLLKCE